MRLELLEHAGKTAGYNFIPENPAEESVLKDVFDREKFPVREYCKKILQFISADYALHDVKTLTKLGEITVKEVVEEPEEYLVCAECGSRNVQVTAWVYPNEGNAYACEAGEDAWCEECDEHVKLELIRGKRNEENE
jgi:Zn finger protein HypA/HybF involved in hydrogenase expression